MNYNQLTTSDFVRKGNIIHNNKYDYSNVYYINSRMKVCIICPKHGEFWQIPANHLCGKGCKECQRETLIVKNSSNTDDFIKKSKIIHDGRYEYSKVDYVNAHKKICIVCFEHGEFWQTPNSHLNGRGCPYCAKVSKGENKIDKFLVSSKIKFVREKRFDGCKGARQPLPFDFYLPDSNTCIEYDGKQHFDKKASTIPMS